MLKILCLFCLTLAALGSGRVWAEKTGDVADLGQYVWKNRLLFLFSPSPEAPAYKALSDELRRNPDGVRDRDLLVFRILEQGPSLVGSQEMSPQEAEELRRRFGAGRGALTMVLVGKDGGVKLQRSEPVALSDIFGLIDSMPMRQREMQLK